MKRHHNDLICGRQSGYLRLRLAPVSAVSLLLVLAAWCSAIGQVSTEQFLKMVRTELERSGSKSDSLGTPLRVLGYGEETRNSIIVPVMRDGRLVAVYKDDPMRSWVTRVANEPVLKSVKLQLLSSAGAREYLQEKGFTGAEPIAVSFGPFSLFGVVETGWLMPKGDSFVLLSLEGRVVTEADVSRFWQAKLPWIKQALSKAANPR